MNVKLDEPESDIDNILAARRLAQFCPTSFSIDDFKAPTRKQRIAYIPPTPSVKTELISEPSPFKINLPSPKHRFGFLLADIKPINKEKTNQNNLKMKYELPNVKKVDTPVKTDKPLMVVSFSSTQLNNSDQGKQTTPTSTKSADIINSFSSPTLNDS